MRTIKSLIAVLLTAAVLGLGLSSCNTVHGAGKDIQKGGQAIENSADRNR